MARLAGAFFGHPARSLLSVGVTGTNGKTTVTHLLASIFEAQRWPTTVIGTLDGARTTPESPDLQRLLAEARDRGTTGPWPWRCRHTRWHRPVWTGSFRRRGVHQSFPRPSRLPRDHRGVLRRQGIAVHPGSAPLWPWSTGTTPGVASILDAGRRADRGVLDGRGQRARDHPGPRPRSRGGDAASSWPWPGPSTPHNALAAATTAAALGVPDDIIVTGLDQAAPVPGRFEVVPTTAPFTVVVDYAHTPEGLRVALDSARGLARGHRVLCVFGCGGDRDRDKRPAMGAGGGA